MQIEEIKRELEAQEQLLRQWIKQEPARAKYNSVVQTLAKAWRALPEPKLEPLRPETSSYPREDVDPKDEE
jgi:hypothetical protein